MTSTAQRTCHDNWRQRPANGDNNHRSRVRDANVCGRPLKFPRRTTRGAAHLHLFIATVHGARNAADQAIRSCATAH